MSELDETAALLADLRRLSDRDPDALARRHQILAAKDELLARLHPGDEAATAPPAPLPPRTCARAGCDGPVPRNPRGRPTIYCSPSCRPSAQRAARGLVVEVRHPDTSPDGRPPERVWTVTLRRGDRAVVIADDLGWPSAHALARQLEDLVAGPVRTEGAAVG